MSLKNPTLLLIEDSEDDVFFLRHALKKAGVPYPMRVVNNGQEAIDYLSGAGKYHERETYPMPSFIFLDLKLPLVSGFGVLEWLRSR